VTGFWASPRVTHTSDTLVDAVAVRAVQWHGSIIGRMSHGWSRAHPAIAGVVAA
jgi:hypothetical protein